MFCVWGNLGIRPEVTPGGITEGERENFAVFLGINIFDLKIAHRDKIRFKLVLLFLRLCALCLNLQPCSLDALKM